MPDDYKGPETNFDLVQQADTILVGTLVKSIGNDEYDRKILVKPTLLLKGQRLPTRAHIRGQLSDRTYEFEGKKFKLRVMKSEPLDLWRPHPDVWKGGCSRTSFEKGAQLLLFFHDDKGKLDWFDPPFTRSSEDVSGPEALWVRAVKTYARIAKLPTSAQRTALTKEMETLRKEFTIGSNENSLLADDIERQIAKSGPFTYIDERSNTEAERRWVYNIFNEIYISKASSDGRRFDIDPAPKNRTAIGVGLAVFVLAVALSGLAIIRRRKRIQATL